MLDLARALPRPLMSDNGSHHSQELSIPSDTAATRRVHEDVEQALRALGYADREVFGIRLALEEALVNAIKHGNQYDAAKKVHVRYKICRDQFAAHVRDEGPGFDPDDVPDPMAPENLERDCGRGLLLMRHYMTEVIHHEPGNALTMRLVRRFLDGPGS